MEFVAIVAEFNPLHWGHHFIIQEAKKSGLGVLILMSGSFNQRGEPCVLDKYTRAKDAISAGADIVITHPVTSATSHGEEFSLGSMEMVMKLPNIKKIYCGGENLDDNLMKKALDIDARFDDYLPLFKDFLKMGESYSNSLRKTYESIDSSLNEIFQPNMLLAYGYAKALNKRNKLDMLSIVKRREGPGWDKFVSASEIRRLRIKEDAETIKKITFKNGPKYQLNDLLDRLYSVYRSHFYFQEYDLSQFEGYEIGLENRLKKAFKIAETFSDFISSVSTKRYSRPRIQRLLLHSYLNIKKETIDSVRENQTSFHVLAFSPKGQEYLRESKNSKIKLFVNFKDIDKFSEEEKYYHLLEAKSTDLWALLTNNPLGFDYSRKYK